MRGGIGSLLADDLAQRVGKNLLEQRLKQFPSRSWSDVLEEARRHIQAAWDRWCDVGDDCTLVQDAGRDHPEWFQAAYDRLQQDSLRVRALCADLFYILSNDRVLAWLQRWWMDTTSTDLEAEQDFRCMWSRWTQDQFCQARKDVLQVLQTNDNRSDEPQVDIASESAFVRPSAETVTLGGSLRFQVTSSLFRAPCHVSMRARCEIRSSKGDQPPQSTSWRYRIVILLVHRAVAPSQPNRRPSYFCPVNDHRSAVGRPMEPSVAA